MEPQTLAKNKTLVIGASTNPSRYSNMAINRLLLFKKGVRALGLRKGEVNGIEIETEKVEFDDIDTVTLYIGPQNQPEYYDYVVSLHPKRVIFNPGTENTTFYQILDQAGIEHFEACTLVLLNTGQY
ncbi:MAG: CoA-binding protein [Saprospiraceae bacterium]|nr:CoA-binding protein [Saprospiraceae bacterium]